jgi:aromatic-L-amino-acid decarboxylase
LTELGQETAAPLTDLREDGAAALEWAARYLERVGDLPVLAQVTPGEIRERLPPAPPEEPEPFSAVLRDLDELLLPGITHWQHPRYFAYFATSSCAPAILAELLAATLNSVAFLWRTSPAATELERVVLRWTAELLGVARSHRGHRLDVDAGGSDRRAHQYRPRPRDLLRARAFLGGQGGADAGNAVAEGPGRREVPHATGGDR